MIRVIDSDVLLRAKNDYYRFETCPGFWRWLSGAFEAKEIISTRKVLEEITVQEGCPLADWAIARKKYFPEPDQNDTDAYSEVVAHVDACYDNEDHRTEFLDVKKADPWVVAIAKAKGGTVVTNEKWIKCQRNSKVKIPNVCGELSVDCEENIFDFMIERGVCLDLRGK